MEKLEETAKKINHIFSTQYIIEGYLKRAEFIDNETRQAMKIVIKNLPLLTNYLCLRLKNHGIQKNFQTPELNQGENK